MGSRTLGCALATVGTLLLGGSVWSRAWAQTNVGLSAGTEYGFGLIATTGTRAMQLEAAGGLAPVLFAATDYAGEFIFRAYFPGAVGGKVSFAINKEGPRRAIKVGATYNTLIKLGVGGGLDVWLNDRVKVAAGIMVYPQAKKAIVERLNKDEGTNYTLDNFESTAIANMQPFVAFSYFFR